jgi:hypothetical protein
MQELLEYWALVVDITQRSLPNIPRILLHVSAMYCKVMHRVEKKFRYCETRTYSGSTASMLLPS